MEFLTQRAELLEAVGVAPERDGRVGPNLADHATKPRVRLKGLLERLRREHGVAAAEVADLDVWNRARIGVAEHEARLQRGREIGDQGAEPAVDRHALIDRGTAALRLGLREGAAELYGRRETVDEAVARAMMMAEPRTSVKYSNVFPAGEGW